MVTPTRRIAVGGSTALREWVNISQVIGCVQQTLVFMDKYSLKDKKESMLTPVNMPLSTFLSVNRFSTASEQTYYLYLLCSYMHFSTGD